MSKKDITGQKFGLLTAVRPVRSEPKAGVIWLCRCDCGGEKEVPLSRLTRGLTQSCGCLAREHTRCKDITGQRFGRLVAKEFRYYNEKHQDCWLFQCDCGQEKVLPAANVKWGNTRSCGCKYREHAESLKRQDITGQRFDRLVALCPTAERDAAGATVWKCQCDCGKTAFYSINLLNSGRIHSCGCVYKETRPECYTYRRDLVEGTELSALVVSKGLRSNNTSGCTGVYQEKKKGRWLAYIDFQRKRYFLGSYPEREQAVRARKAAERVLHDPLLEEKLDCLTEQSRKAFLDYLRGCIQASHAG